MATDDLKNLLPTSQTRSLPSSLYLRTTFLLLPWLLHLLVTNLLLSLLLPLSLFFPTLCYDLSSLLAASVWNSIQNIFTVSNKAQILLSGTENLRQGESAIVVANHVEWTDFYMIQALALKAGMLGRCRWFAKQQLKWVPFLGWGLWAMGMPLVSRRWTEDRREMERVFKGVKERAWPIWLISYSEATRYTPSKRLEAEAFCRTHSKRLGQHVLYPRTKGFIACVQNLRTTKHVKAVYDITIAYAKRASSNDGTSQGTAAAGFQSPPVFAETVLIPDLSREWTFFVHVDRYPLAELPESDEGLAKWLEERWVEKGERLESLRARLERGLPWTDFESQN